jgi:predicted enzyme related to lactoylglutathione lyase
MSTGSQNARSGTARVGNVLYPAPDVERLVAFYRDALGLPVKFQDGDRFAALDGGAVTFALAGREEDVAGGPAVSFKVDDVEATVERLIAAGADIIRPPEAGPHEVRAVVRDPAGNPVIVYGPLP